MNLSELRPAPGSKKNRKRVGRGTGSRHGKTSTRGSNGQNARSGGGVRPGFEGGQLPIQRRLPKRGFSNARYKTEYAVVNIGDLEFFEAGSVVSIATLREAGMVKALKDGVKILGNGELSKSLTVQANAFSKSAEEKITAAGGKAEVV
ncbi:MAG TPA: 50S ribosomal protein L15 [Firmicutes bacterium]|nr:50S ribosomal protein L15 [Bacillota bacterium]